MEAQEAVVAVRVDIEHPQGHLGVGHLPSLLCLWLPQQHTQSQLVAVVVAGLQRL